MLLETWLYYTLAVLVLTASPGPSVLLCLTKSVTEGFSASICTALGSLTAILIIMSLSFSGLGVVIASSQNLFDIIKWVGTAYLLYLGYKAFTNEQTSYDIEHGIKQKQSTFSLFVSGFIVGASNPKALVFFIALFPQFISTTDALLPQYGIFCLTFSVLELSWLLAYAYFGSKSSKWLLQNGRAKFFNKITGGVFVGAGVLLSTSRV